MDEFWFLVPDREEWKYWKAEVQLENDIDLELMMDEIEIFEVGDHYV